MLASSSSGAVRIGATLIVISMIKLSKTHASEAVLLASVLLSTTFIFIWFTRPANIFDIKSPIFVDPISTSASEYIFLVSAELAQASMYFFLEFRAATIFVF